MSQPKILIVEDEAIVAMDLKLHLQQLGYDVANGGYGGGQSGEGEREVGAIW